MECTSSPNAFQATFSASGPMRARANVASRMSLKHRVAPGAALLQCAVDGCPVGGLAEDAVAVFERDDPHDGVHPSGRRRNQRVRSPPFEEIAYVAADDGIQRLARLATRKLESGPILQIGQTCVVAQASIVGHCTSSTRF